MRYYLLPISDREPLAWVLSEGRTAFPSYRRREAEALEVGDKLLLYTTRGCFRNPTRDRGRVIGVASVAGPASVLAEPVRFGEREFPIGMDLTIDQLAPRGAGAELAPLIPKLSESFPNPRAWSARLRRALVPVSARDASMIQRALAKSVQPPGDVTATYATR
jgi:hypothetical protein